MNATAVLQAEITAAQKGGAGLTVAGAELLADASGALFWPEHGLLCVADLHLEKGSSFARRGMLLPPYDTAITLVGLSTLIARYAPKIVVALGDNFHDGHGAGRLSDADRATLTTLQRKREWTWITGNHDPDPTDGIGGSFSAEFKLGPLVFRHEPRPNASDGEIAGHLHPVARISQRGRTISRRCFATNSQRLVMPAFGAYTGGLNIRHPAFLNVFGRSFTAHMLGAQRLYAITSARCLGD